MMSTLAVIQLETLLATFHDEKDKLHACIDGVGKYIE
jgi:hypothetical protein